MSMLDTEHARSTVIAALYTSKLSLLYYNLIYSYILWLVFPKSDICLFPGRKYFMGMPFNDTEEEVTFVPHH